MKRRELLAAIVAAPFLSSMGRANASTVDAAASTGLDWIGKITPRARVLIANDLSGDVDGVFATAHALLSPSTQICGIIGTAARDLHQTAARSAELAHELLEVMELSGSVPVHRGATHRMDHASVPVECPGAEAIIQEAMKESDIPLYVTAGAGLTEIASALIIRPEIAERMTVVWIGGASHDAGGPEYNFSLDPLAAQVLFNGSQVRLIQIPSDAYGLCQISVSEVQDRLKGAGPLGDWLLGKLLEATKAFPWNTGETWTMGDSPLVLLTALTSWLPSSRVGQLRYEGTSSKFRDIKAPRLAEDGTYHPKTDGRQMRVFDSIDTRLMFEDFFAKIRKI